MRRFLTALCRGAAPFLAAAMLLFAAAAIKSLLEVRPPEAYVDEGVHTFTASSGYSTARRGHYQTKYHRYTTHYVYVVVYRAPGGWRWEQDVFESEGKEAVRSREQVERRVLSLAGEDSYITVDPELTPQRYAAQQRRTCLAAAGGCLAVLAAEGALWLAQRRRQAAKAK